MLSLTMYLLIGVIWLSFYVLLVLPAQIVWFFLTLPLYAVAKPQTVQAMQIKVKFRLG